MLVDLKDKSQVTIPRRLMKKLNLKAGDRLEIEEEAEQAGDHVCHSHSKRPGLASQPRMAEEGRRGPKRPAHPASAAVLVRSHSLFLASMI